MVPAFLSTILFALSGVAAGRTTRLLGGTTANAIRIVLATAVLALWAHTLGMGISGGSFPFFLLSGAIGFGLGDTALYQALPRIGSRLSIMVVHCFAAPLAALAEWLWLGTALEGSQLFAIALVLAGVGMALVPDRVPEGEAGSLWTGFACAFVAAGGQGFGAVLSRKAYEVAGKEGLAIDGLTATYQRILAGLAIGVAVYALARWRRREAAIEAPVETGRISRAAPWVLLNAAAGPVLGVACFQWALSRHASGLVLPIVALTPLVIIPFSAWIDGERPSKRSATGAAIAVTGAVLLAIERNS